MQQNLDLYIPSTVMASHFDKLKKSGETSPVQKYSLTYSLEIINSTTYLHYIHFNQQAHKCTGALQAGTQPRPLRAQKLRKSNHTSVTMVPSESTPGWNLEKSSYSEM